VASTAKANGADFLILDTAPNADQVVSLAARAADLVLIPCRPAAFDLEAIETTLLLAKAAMKPAYVVLNSVPPRSGIGKEAAAGLKGRGANVAPHQLTHRAAFAHGVIDGRTAQEFEPQGKAAEEVQALYKWLCGIVDMSTRGHSKKAALVLPKRPSLFAAQPAPYAPTLAAEETRLPVFEPVERQTGRPPSRAGKRVLSVYLDPLAWKQLRQLALDTETSTQSLGEEAVNLLFAKHGLNRTA